MKELIPTMERIHPPGYGMARDQIRSIQHWVESQHVSAKKRQDKKTNKLEQVMLAGKAKAYLDVMVYIRERFHEYQGPHRDFPETEFSRKRKPIKITADDLKAKIKEIFPGIHESLVQTVADRLINTEDPENFCRCCGNDCCNSRRCKQLVKYADGY